MKKLIAVVAGEPNSINSEIIVKAWKKKNSEVYKLLNFEADIAFPTKGHDCDWPPHIGKIE